MTQLQEMEEHQLLDNMDSVGHHQARGRPVRSSFPIRLAFQPLHQTAALLVPLLLASSSLAISLEVNSSVPYTYTKLRHDIYFLPLARPYQHSETWREKPLKLTVRDEPNKQNKTVRYYVNDKVDLSKLDEDDFLFEALDQTYQSRLIQPKVADFDRPGDMEASADPRLVDPGRCARELAYLESKLNSIDEAHLAGFAAKGISPELATFLESTSPEEPGLLVGNNYWIGNYRQCRTRQVLDPQVGEPVSFTGRYCVASLRSPKWEPLIEQRAQQLEKRQHFKYPGQADHYRQFFRIQVGFCLPLSCQSSSMKLHPKLIRRLATRRLEIPRKEYSLTGLYCLPDEGSPLRKPDLSGYLLLLCCCLWAAAMLVATLADLGGWKAPESVHQRGLADKLVVTLSLRESWRTLMKPPHPIGARKQPEAPKQQVGERSNGRCGERTILQVSSQDVRFLDAFKVIMMVFILAAHVSMFNHIYSRFPLDFDVALAWYYYIITSSTFQVDWFFCITGFIVTYVSFASRAVWTKPAAAWIYSIFHRYWRLAPCYILLFWYTRSLSALSSSGPLWDYGTSNMSSRAICRRESWIQPLTLTQNSHPLHEECIIPSWYIANDMQFYLITPAILLLMAHRAYAGWLLLLSLISACIVARFYSYWNNPRAQYLELMRPRMDLVMRNNWDAHELYVQPHYRIAPYLIGILAGHHAYMARSGKWTGSPLTGPRAVMWRTLLAWSGFAMCLSMQFVTGLLDLYPRSLEPYAKIAACFAYSTSHAFAGLGPALLFTALLFGQWPAIKRLFERPIFTYLSRINYLVYLYQVEVIVYLIQTYELQIGMALPEQLRLLAFSAATLYPLAFVGTLLIANPLARLESEFIGGLFMPKKASQSPSPNKPPESQLLHVTQSDTGESVRLVEGRHEEQVAGAERSTVA